MMGLIGKKVGMTQIFDEWGRRMPVTVIDVSGNLVLQKKSAESDGYDAVKLGYGEVSAFRLTKPRRGVFTKLGLPARRYLREFRLFGLAGLDDFEVGQELQPSFFKRGEFVDVTGTTKGHGFTGVMKRHGFHGSKATHGNHETNRHGGSIGTSATPSRVVKGKKMAGQTGNARRTIQNLVVVSADDERGVVLIRGGIPGPAGGIVEIRRAIKKG